MELRKEEFLNIFKNNMYDLFYIPVNSISWLFDVEPYLNTGKKVLNKTEMQKLIDSNYNGYYICNQFFALRAEGKMFTYNRPVVPISIYSMYTPGKVEKKKFKKIQNKGYFNFRFYAHTIDDASMSIWHSVDKLDELDVLYKAAKEFLYIYKEMPNAIEFETFWRKYGVTEFDYN